ncbi:MAG: FAD-binding oxidoreductase [Nannocystaceae bacterium]|nr:FAD-binding oxidoreductase [bacterium]
MSDETLISALVDAVGADHVKQDADELGYYGSDRCRGTWSVDPRVIVLPKTVEQVQAVVRAAASASAKIVPSGGRTGLTGAATATGGEVVLSLERMNRILSVDVPGQTLRCEAGATVEAVQIAAAAEDLLYPVDFAAKGSAQIGGSIATNAGGVKVLRYGSTRSWVSGLDVVTASGELLHLGGSLVKDNTGYDLRQLFIGAEGTLGIIVGATMRLCTPPKGLLVALCSVPSDAHVLSLFTRARRELPLQAFECFDQGCLKHVLEHRGITGRGPFAEPSPQHVLIEIEIDGHGDDAQERAHDLLTLCLADAQDAGEIEDAVVAATAAQAHDLWDYREGISESLHGHTPHKSDIALPISEVTAFLEVWRPAVAKALPDAEALVFGHVGDGNLHLNVLKPPAESAESFVARAKAFDEETYALVQRFGGSVSAEHGIGLLKRDHLHFTRSDGELTMMRAIKAALDPRGMFNPGKVLPA